MDEALSTRCQGNGSWNTDGPTPGQGKQAIRCMVEERAGGPNAPLYGVPDALISVRLVFKLRKYIFQLLLEPDGRCSLAILFPFSVYSQGGH